MADTEERPAISAAIIADDGKVLDRPATREGRANCPGSSPLVRSSRERHPEQAAVRETSEEVGLTVKASKFLGQRVHPKTGRTMCYVACDVVSGDATVADEEELDSLASVEHGQLPEYVPYGLWEPVQQHLDTVLKP